MFWRYLRYLLRHKWFVFVECCKLGIPWRGIVHDLSKFLPSEWLPYALTYYGPWKYDQRPDWLVTQYDLAWHHHQHRNPHHWEYWICLDRNPAPTNSANVVESLDREKISDMADVSVICVPSISVNGRANISPDGEIPAIGIIVNIQQNMQLNTDKTKRKLVKNIAAKCLSIMVEIHRAVLVAVNHVMNFFVWTTKKAAVNNIENKSVAVVYVPTDGQLRTVFRPSSAYSATTVTPPTDTTVIVRIKTIQPMPDKYRREMLADWRGAGRALGKPDTKAWYKQHAENIELHPETRTWIEANLCKS